MRYILHASYTLGIFAITGIALVFGVGVFADDHHSVDLSPSVLWEGEEITQPAVGEQMMAALVADDPTGMTWQWARSQDGEIGWEDIKAATSTQYIPTGDDVGWYLRATVSYTDGDGNTQSAEAITTDQVALGAQQGGSGVRCPWCEPKPIWTPTPVPTTPPTSIPDPINDCSRQGRDPSAGCPTPVPEPTIPPTSNPDPINDCPQGRRDPSAGCPTPVPMPTVIPTPISSTPVSSTPISSTPVPTPLPTPTSDPCDNRRHAHDCHPDYETPTPVPTSTPVPTPLPTPTSDPCDNRRHAHDCHPDYETPTPVPTNTPNATPALTNTPTPTPTPTATPTPTPSPTPVPAVDKPATINVSTPDSTVSPTRCSARTSWAQVPGATEYELWWTTIGNEGQESATGRDFITSTSGSIRLSGTRYTLNNAFCQTRYEFKIRARSDGGGDHSTEWSGFTVETVTTGDYNCADCPTPIPGSSPTPNPTATAISGPAVPTEGYQADKIVQYRIDASVDVDTHKALTRAADSWNLGFGTVFPGEDTPSVCERSGGARDPHELTRCPNDMPDDDGNTLTVSMVTEEQAKGLGGCSNMTLACVQPTVQGSKPIPIGNQTLYILETPVIPSKELDTLAEPVEGIWTNDSSQHQEKNADGEIQIYLPGILKHEIGHPLGFADMDDDWEGRLMNASPEALDDPILTVEDVEIETAQDYYNGLASEGLLSE